MRYHAGMHGIVYISILGSYILQRWLFFDVLYARIPMVRKVFNKRQENGLNNGSSVKYSESRRNGWKLVSVKYFGYTETFELYRKISKLSFLRKQESSNFK